MREIKDKLLHILLESETEDLVPPYRGLQPIDIKVAGKKVDKILSLIQIEVDCPECEYKDRCEDDPQKPDYCPKRGAINE